METNTFIVNEENLSVTINRTFKAPLEKVWDAFTNHETLDKWWAPKPWKCRTKRQNFINGGEWLYAMVGPENEEHWAITTYKNISENNSFGLNDAFCDENGVINSDLPTSEWKLDFTEHDHSTQLKIVVKQISLEDLKTLIKMGFQEGFEATLESLRELLEEK